MAQAKKQSKPRNTQKIDTLNDMLSHLTETQPHEVAGQEECEELIKTYFDNRTNNVIPINKHKR